MVDSSIYHTYGMLITLILVIIIIIGIYRYHSSLMSLTITQSQSSVGHTYGLSYDFAVNRMINDIDIGSSYTVLYLSMICLVCSLFTSYTHMHATRNYSLSPLMGNGSLRLYYHCYEHSSCGEYGVE